MVNLNFSSVPSRDPVPKGIYTLVISKVEATTAKSSGNAMIAVTFDVDGTESNKVFENCVLTEKGLWKLQALMSALGYDVEKDLESFDEQEMVGQAVKAKIIVEDYEGSPVNRIKKYMPA